MAPGGGDGGGFRRGPVGIRTAIGGVHARVRPRTRGNSRAGGGGSRRRERRAKKPTKATERKRCRRRRASPAERMLRDARATLTSRAERSCRGVRFREARRPRARARRNARRRDGVGGRRRTARRRIAAGPADAASTSPAPPPPRLERTSPESLPEPEKLKRLNMASLRALLQVRGLPTDGMKYLLVARLDQNRGAPLNADNNAARGGGSRGRGVARPRPQPRARLPVWGPGEKTVRRGGPEQGQDLLGVPPPRASRAVRGFPVANGDAPVAARAA